MDRNGGARGSGSGGGGCNGMPVNVRETGILRKNKKHVPENFDDLLIVGYQSKIFRDDEKALFVDQGKHLIPWMGDDSLKIDRLIQLVLYSNASADL